MIPFFYDLVYAQLEVLIIIKNQLLKTHNVEPFYVLNPNQENVLRISDFFPRKTPLPYTERGVRLKQNKYSKKLLDTVQTNLFEL